MKHLSVVCLTIMLLSCALSTNAQTSKRYSWVKIAKFFSIAPEYDDPQCDDCYIKVFFNSNGRATDVVHYENGRRTDSNELRYIGNESGCDVYEVLGKFGTGTHSGIHYYIGEYRVNKVHYSFVLDGMFTTDGHFTDIPAFAFIYELMD